MTIEHVDVQSARRQIVTWNKVDECPDRQGRWQIGREDGSHDWVFGDEMFIHKGAFYAEPQLTPLDEQCGLSRSVQLLITVLLVLCGVLYGAAIYFLAGGR